ncbi:DUF1761 domain-containing protein [Candidatus Pacearchaeota archaeon]|nr:DUF1761 domain-containing protein [Candidatus Pacearchaeota archaeon]
MALPIVDVNYLAVVVAGLVSFVIGGLWYSPLIFGNIWMKESGINKSQVDKSKKKGMTASYIITLVSALVMAYVLANFVKYVAISSAIDALELGFCVWLGFIATVGLGSILWEGKSFRLYAINMGYYLISLILMSVILTLWV